ncbi:MAG: hypothetical protein M5R37_02125 [Melioribacteraceae bacterium]|nr:hypothetical protein [Melioribacteraceae bacterium]
MNQYSRLYPKKELKNFDFEFALTHYNIYPWVKKDNELLRIFETANKTVVIADILKSNQDLSLNIYAQKKLNESDVEWAFDKLVWSLGLKENYADVIQVSKNDEILRTALEYNKGIRPKRYFSLFEAACGAICAQNVDFRRLYKMMFLLAEKFGKKVTFRKENYFSFPSHTDLLNKTEDEIRECKVGYRAKSISKLAKWFEANIHLLDQKDLKTIPPKEAIDILCQLPGIGPYSATIMLSVGVGRSDIFHFDSFTKQILKTFYFDNNDVTEESLSEFIQKRWKGFEGKVAHILTTNTHLWAKNINGYEEFNKLISRAREN